MNANLSTSTTISTSTSPTPGLLRSEKIGARHLERLAFVYVRQSSPQQLIRNQESTQVQYGLKRRAVDLGWSEDRVVVIDEDLGKTGATSEGRAGFQRLVAEVTLNHVGIILGVDMSRLARSCKDWYQLLEVCSIFGTLIADLDGVYDPAQYNDRLLLGLKGTMSEAELHILKQRMHQGKLNKARRGDLIMLLPIGYLRRPSGEVVLDPDEEVQAVVQIIFAKFEELGTLHSTLRFLVAQDIKVPVRAYSGLTKGDLEWHRPNRMTLQNMLKNPMYAGAYAYGRRAIDPRRKIPGRPATGRTVVPPEQCHAFLKDRFPAYITWDQYQAHLERLRTNRAVSEEIGAVRRGPSLLSGLLVCGKCGARMPVRYSGRENRHVYSCTRMLTDRGESACQSVAGRALDAFVTTEVLRALAPASVDLSLAAAGNIERQRSEMDNLWQKRLERAGYEALHAERHYRCVEPENRMVARELARQWEEKLQAQREVQEEYERFARTQPRVLTSEERETIRTLAENIPAVWTAPTTTDADRKEILRQVIDRIRVDVAGGSERVRLAVDWAGGTRTEHEIVRPVARWEQLSYWPQLSNRVRELAQKKLTAREIAQRLNDEGWRPAKRRSTFVAGEVIVLLERLGLNRQRSRSEDRTGLDENEWWLPTLARELEMPPITLYSWVRRGWVRHRRAEDRRLILWADPGEIDRLRKLRTVPHGYHVRHRWVPAVDLELTHPRVPAQD